MAPRQFEVESSQTITSVFEAQYARFCRLAYLLTGDRSRAEEIVMEAFVRSLSRWRSVREPEAYVRRAVVNLSRNRLRRAFLERRPPTDQDSVTLPADPADHIWAAVRALPPRQRAAIVLRYWDDLSDAEISAALGCAVGTVKSQLSKARASLARSLGKQEDQ